MTLRSLAALATVFALALTAWALRPSAHRTVAASTAAHDGPAASPTPHSAMRRATRRAAERAYPDAIEMIVLAVRAGYMPAAAIAVALPHLPAVLRPAFAQVAARTGAGQRFADAIAALPAAIGPLAAPLADSFAAADRYGQPLAPVLARLADEARQQRRRQADTLARQLPVRMSLPLVLCTLPSFVFLAIVPLLLAAFSSLQR
ncbi:MAG: type II secretion system F family protein [Ilumatobacteraceae bacterium]